MHIGDTLGRRALYTPERSAVVDTGKEPSLRLDFKRMNERANRFANWLSVEANVEKGDRVAVLARDGIEHLDCFFACGKLGAIHVPLNWRLHWRELADPVRIVTPRVLLFSDDFVNGVASLVSGLGGSPHPIGRLLHLDGHGVESSLRFEDALACAEPTPVECETVSAEDTAALIFTGGTTGLPRAARISHRMIAWNTLNTVIHDLRHDDVYLNVFPLFHTGGLFVYTLPQFILGGATVLMPQFDPAKALTLIEQERVTVFAAVPAMYQAMTQAPNWADADLSSLRFCTSGGAPLPVPLVEQYTREKSVRFKQGFGMTEFGPGIFALAPEDAVRKAGSIGRPNFFVSARVVDDENRPLGPDQVGELALKGDSLCSGYFGAANDDGLRLTDDEGWFHTGDMARYDEDLYFYIVDRKKDMFISGGENIYPAEIEAAMYRHPAVHMCAVIGVPDDRWGEVGRAHVVLKPGAKADEDELKAFLRDRLAGYKIPKTVVFAADLPLSGTGKILKRALRRRSED